MPRLAGKETGAPSLADIATPSANLSPPDWAVELVRQVNAAIPENVGRERCKPALQARLGSSHQILSKLHGGAPPPPARFDPASVADPDERRKFAEFVEKTER